MTTSDNVVREGTAGVLSSRPPDPPKVDVSIPLGRREWQEFRNTGLLFFINQILHAFGWAITIVVEDNGSISEAYPARLSARGFSDESISNGYKKVAKYLKDNAENLYKEIQ